MKLKTASGMRLADCYQSWRISRDSYTPSEPINSSSENELGEGNQRQAIEKRTSIWQEAESSYQAKGIKRASKANFSLFFKSSRELFL